MLKKWLLISGILASTVRIAVDIISAMLYPGYSLRDQTMSQLAAAGAPTQKLQLIILAAFDILVSVFGIGVLSVSGKKISAKISGICLILFGLTGFAMLFYPQAAMQLKEGLAPQIPHIIATALGVFLILLFIGFGAFTFKTGFRFFSFAMIFSLIFFAGVTGTMAPKAVNFAYPWMGILERISYYSYLVWIGIFSVMLLRTKKASK